MWKCMLHTDQLEIQMNAADKSMEMNMTGNERGTKASVLLHHADLVELIHTLLEINRNFRGDIPFYEEQPHEHCS